jgi:hypothetical protein
MTILEPMPVAPTKAMGRFDIGDTDDILDRMMERTAGLRERQVAELDDDDEVGVGEVGLAGTGAVCSGTAV